MNKFYYQFNETQFITLLSKYKSCFQVFYPCKVNSMDCVLDLIDTSGSSFEVDSLNMIEHLIFTRNIAPSRILYNYLARSKEETERAFNSGVRLFAVDTLDSIRQLEKMGARTQVLIRISITSLTNIVDDNFVDKWGASIEIAKKMSNYIKSKCSNVKLKGYSFYYPQEYNTLERIFKAIKIIEAAFGDSDSFAINIGGGVSVEDAEILAKKFQNRNLIVEPGRHLVGDCLDFVCKINAIRKNNNRNYIFLNVGVYSGFIDNIVKKHHFSIEPLVKGNESVKLKKYLVCGCTSDISDTFGEFIFNENDISVGTLMIIKNCGAYCPQLYTEFSGHKNPCVKIM